MISRRQTERAIELHADQLSAFPNVVGVGMSDTVDDDRPRTARARAVAVYVSTKKPASELGAGDLLPGYVEIDDGDDTVKVPVKVIEMGEFRPETEEATDTEIQHNDDGDGSTFFPE